MIKKRACMEFKELTIKDILEGIIGAVGVVLSICFIFIILATI